jgi:uroporphyrinogen decarboxylase
MTGRERFQAALHHQEPDMVPIFECVYSRPLFQEVLGYVPETFDPVSVFACSRRIGYDFVIIPIPGVSGFRPLGLKDAVYVDEWKIKRKMVPNTWPIDAGISVPLTGAEDWKNYDMPDPEEDFRYAGLRDVKKLSEEARMGVVGNVRGPYSGAWQLFGMENFAYLMYEEPEVIHSVLAACTEFSLACSRRMTELGVDAVMFSDDYGSTQQPLMSPSHFRSFVKPHLQRLVQESKKLGVKALLHSDGNIGLLVPDCVDTGIDGLHPIERNAGMDLAGVKREYGDRLCLFGNVDNNRVLVNGTPAQVEEAVKECIRAAAPGGGYCLGSDHSVHDDIPNENVFALYEAGRKYGRYPINV